MPVDRARTWQSAASGCRRIETPLIHGPARKGLELPWRRAVPRRPADPSRTELTPCPSPVVRGRTFDPGDVDQCHGDGRIHADTRSNPEGAALERGCADNQVPCAESPGHRGIDRIDRTSSGRWCTTARRRDADTSFFVKPGSRGSGWPVSGCAGGRDHCPGFIGPSVEPQGPESCHRTGAIQRDGSFPDRCSVRPYEK